MIKAVGELVFWKDVLAEAERTGNPPRVGGIDVSKAIYPHSVVDFALLQGPYGNFIFASAGGVVRAFSRFYADDLQSFFLTIDLQQKGGRHEYVVSWAGNKKSEDRLSKIKRLSTVEDNIRLCFSKFDLLGNPLLPRDPAPAVRFTWNVTSSD